MRCELGGRPVPLAIRRRPCAGTGGAKSTGVSVAGIDEDWLRGALHETQGLPPVRREGVP